MVRTMNLNNLNMNAKIEELLSTLNKKEEEKEKNKERIRKAYGESASNIGSKSLRKRRHIYLFNMEDLDNDDIIAMVEDSPTYMRDKTTLTKIRTKAALEEEVATEEATDENGVITF